MFLKTAARDIVSAFADTTKANNVLELEIRIKFKRRFSFCLEVGKKKLKLNDNMSFSDLQPVIAFLTYLQYPCDLPNEEFYFDLLAFLETHISIKSIFLQTTNHHRSQYFSFY